MISNLSDDLPDYELNFLRDVERYVSMVPYPLDETLREIYEDRLLLLKNALHNLVVEMRFLNGRFNYEDSLSCYGSTKGSKESA